MASKAKRRLPASHAAVLSAGDLATPGGVRAALAAFGLRLRPSRGQHFLISRAVLARVLDAAGVTRQDTVLEVGAGIGTLTAALARTGARVAAVEVDARFIPVLRATCAPYPGVHVIHADAMRLEPAALPHPPSKVVANLPYAIASPLLIRLLEAGIGRRLVVMVQDEVAARIAAPPGGKTFGLLSVAVQAYATPQIVARVPRSAFFPPPDVRSAVVRLDVREQLPLPKDLMPALMAVARAAFGQRRKMLRSALQRVGTRTLSAATVEALCARAGIDPRRRGETLSVEEFARLALAFNREWMSGGEDAGADPAEGASREVAMLDYQAFYATHARGAERSLIRELLKVSRAGKGLISFAGGFPDPATFPVTELQEVTREVLTTGATLALQYGPTEGDPVLRDELARWMAKDGIITGREGILVTTSSQQALDVIGKVFLDPGDIVVVELPSYLGGLQVFRAYGAEVIGVPQDDEGMDTDRLAVVLRRLAREGRRPKFIYAVPDFQNPSGVTWTRQRRERLLALAGTAGCLVVEDNPYREMRFSGEAPPPIVALDPDGRTIYLSTFSKTLAPGLRIGWIAGPDPVIAQCVTLKQAMDLCSPSFTQAIAAGLLRRGVLLRRLPATIELYRRKRDAMLEALQRDMPKGVTWTRPDGGLFLWVRLPDGLDCGAMLRQAVDEGIMYVPGQPFHADGSGRNTMRLNFSYPSVEEIREGIARLARLVRLTEPAAVHSIHRRGTSVSD